jgi:hypothetical protein
MPYQAGSRLSGESASKLGHLEVLESELVQTLIKQFEYPEPLDNDPSNTQWKKYTPSDTGQPLRLIFAVDGSMQTVKSESMPIREVAFIKTALLRLDPNAIAKLDPDYPHPIALKKMMAESALYHSTVLPLKNVSFNGHKNLDAVREIIFDSIRDPRLDREPYETLKWLLYQKWLPKPTISPEFACPECGEILQGLPPDSDTHYCDACNAPLYSTDVIGFHLEMMEEAASQGVVSAYMLIHETLLLFTAIRHFWEKNKKLLSEALFIKDGPLTLRSQYSKLVPRIRSFLQHAKDQGIPIHLIGQEKTGAFVDHLNMIAKFSSPHTKTDPPSFAVLSHKFIRDEIQRTGEKNTHYGSRTNYGEKVYIKLSSHHSMVLSIPTGSYGDSANFPSSEADLIGFDRILATLPQIVSHRHEGALLPIELANGVASLSSYPSATVLKIFAGLA